jgi:hypothetical protein
MSARLLVTPLQQFSYAGMIAFPRWGLVKSENTHILVNSFKFSDGILNL